MSQHSPKIPILAGPQRLQRVLAAAGLGSRRKCEEYILQGRVSVDGQVVDVLGTKVDVAVQSIEFDGESLKLRRRLYFMLNKPPGVLSTNRDESGRIRVIDLVNTRERIFTIGRLDKSSEGLILLTNDGELANRLTHPRHGISKTYLVRVVGQPTTEQLNQLLSGVRLAEGVARAAEICVRKTRSHFSELEIVLTEGRNREIRRLLAAIGNKVVMLRRIAIGRLRLGELPLGAHRPLTSAEVELLKNEVPHLPSKVNAQPARSRSTGERPSANHRRRSSRSTNSRGPGSRSAKAAGRGRSGRPKRPGRGPKKR